MRPPEVKRRTILVQLAQMHSEREIELFFILFVRFQKFFRHFIRGGRDLLSKQDKSTAVRANFYADSRHRTNESCAILIAK